MCGRVRALVAAAANFGKHASHGSTFDRTNCAHLLPQGPVRVHLALARIMLLHAWAGGAGWLLRELLLLLLLLLPLLVLAGAQDVAPKLIAIAAAVHRA